MHRPKLTKAWEHVLRTQVFDATHPGCLLHDFEAVLDFVGTAGVTSAGKYNLLPLASLVELDERLCRPLRLELKRPQLRSHPYLMGLNLLLRASGMGVVQGAGASARLVVDPVVLRQWQGLNATERYFNLLEAWFFVGRAEMIGETIPLSRGFGTEAALGWQQLPAELARFRPRGSESVYLPIVGRNLFQVALLDLFGLLEVDHPAGPVRAWCPVAVRQTEFSRALFARLLEDGPYVRLLRLSDDEMDDDDETVRFNHLQERLQPDFPAWRNNLEPPRTGPREGVFVFKVSLGKIWRRLAMPAESTLDDMVALILNDLRFDDDHLYMFEYRDRFGIQRRANHPMCDEPPYGDEIQVGQLPLEPGQSMALTYDFGDEWRFDVRLERIDPPEKRKQSPRVVARHGKAPKQYDFGDDD